MSRLAPVTVTSTGNNTPLLASSRAELAVGNYGNHGSKGGAVTVTSTGKSP